MALIALADYQPVSSGPGLRPLDAVGVSGSSSAPRLRSLSEYSAMPSNRPATVTPPPFSPPSLASRIAGLGGQAGSIFGRVSPTVGNVSNLAGGLTRIGMAVGGDGSTAQRVAGGIAGAAQAYGGLAGMTGLAQLPWYVGPAINAVGAGATSKSGGEAAARVGASLFESGVGVLAPGFGPLFGPMFAGIGKEIGRAFTDVPHDVREQAETQRALGQGETMLAEVGTAATPEQLWTALNRGVGTYGVPLDARYRTVDDLLANPGAYSASLQAGINPDFIAGTNAQLTQGVQQTVALMNAARAGDPQAQAALAARGPQRQGYLAKAIALMSGPTLYGSNGNNEGGGGNFATGGGGAPEDVWGTLALSGGMRAVPSNLSQSLGGYNAAGIASLPVDIFQQHGINDIARAYRDIIPQSAGDESSGPPAVADYGPVGTLPEMMRYRLANAPKRDAQGNLYAPGLEGAYPSQIHGVAP